VTSPTPEGSSFPDGHHHYRSFDYRDAGCVFFNKNPKIDYRYYKDLDEEIDSPYEFKDDSAFDHGKLYYARLHELYKFCVVILQEHWTHKWNLRQLSTNTG
jgi:hypothetical protein